MFFVRRIRFSFLEVGLGYDMVWSGVNGSGGFNSTAFVLFIVRKFLVEPISLFWCFFTNLLKFAFYFMLWFV